MRDAFVYEDWIRQILQQNERKAGDEHRKQRVIWTKCYDSYNYYSSKPTSSLQDRNNRAVLIALKKGTLSVTVSWPKTLSISTHIRCDR